VILGAVLLDAVSVWVLVAVASACFVALTLHSRPIALTHAHEGELFGLHVQGMFVCFLLAASLLVIFITRIQGNLRARDAHLADLRQRSVEEHHIVRMGLLASGAAHELGTPLSTLSVILGDWSRLPVIRESRDLAGEVVEMQAQLDRCKTIVSGILMSSGEARGEGTLRTTVNSFMHAAVEEWKLSRLPTRLEYANAFQPDQTIVSDAALKQVIFNVFDNALEASPDWIEIAVDRQHDDLLIAVSDKGAGFDADILMEFGRPYQSTKGRPGGGLGLFLVVNVIRKLGGSVEPENLTGGGACVRLTLPLSNLTPINIR